MSSQIKTENINNNNKYIQLRKLSNIHFSFSSWNLCQKIKNHFNHKLREKLNEILYFSYNQINKK
jgi:hypothetical protein